MYSSELTKGKAYLLPVEREISNAGYYVVRCDDQTFKVRKFKWQRSEPIPQKLKCYVKDIRDGKPVVSQDIASIIADSYKEGKEYTFTVSGPRIGMARSYNIVDDKGFSFILHNAPANLHEGSFVKCSVEKINDINVRLRYRGELAKALAIEFRTFEEWATTTGLQNLEYYEDLMMHLPQFESAKLEYEAENPNWIFSALDAFVENIPMWLEQSDDFCGEERQSSKRSRILRRGANLINKVRGICKYIVEDSDYLMNCNRDQRTEFRRNLTQHMEVLKQYSEAVTLISEGRHISFIDDIFHHLNESGYLYHPKKQFRILMLILRLCPMLLVERMAQLFEILHKWELINWTEEPFRSALVDQLEIFINELSNRVDMISSNESKADNGLIMRMVLAIAIQLFIANDSDNINVPLKRSKFYRYISQINPSSVDLLLRKSITAILGAFNKGEINWQDTGANPAVLVSKVVASGVGTTDNMVDMKTFRSPEVTVELREDSITVTGAGADPESKSIPNDFVPWLHANVSTVDDVKTPNRNRQDDLNACRIMWTDVENSIFNFSDDSTERQIFCIEPTAGEEVDVIIDKVEIKQSTNTNVHSLRFHCKIVSEGRKGDGWLYADQSTFLPWLSARDVDNGLYDGSLDFACDENGNPKVFKVTALVNQNELSFSMVDQLKDHMINLANSGKEYRAFITNFDTSNTHMLCVSQLGFTFRIPVGDVPPHLKSGDVVKVRCLSRADSRMLLMDGEYLDEIPMVRIKKGDVLKALFKDLGEEVGMESDEEDSITVRESEEIMSVDELREVALLFQRKSIAEKKYAVAFNYLGFAHLLAMCCGDQKLQQTIRTHQDLLMQLEYFVRNNIVDADKLEPLATEVKGIPMLERLYTKLEILSIIGHPEKNQRLLDMVTNSTGDDQRLASLVVCYNLLPTEDLQSISRGISEKISEYFNVDRAQENLKYYGVEGPIVEFKSSMIFTNKAADRMQPKPEEQFLELRQIICGMLNTEGGCLYIGVSDAGFQIGLQNDLSYLCKARPRNFPIKGGEAGIDNINTYLSNLLHQQMPELFTNGGQTEVDEESFKINPEKAVIKVTVLPSREPVYVNGSLFVREGSSTYYRKDVADFIANRERLFNRLERTQRIQELDAAQEEEKAQEQPEVASQPHVEAYVAPAESVPSLTTGNLRNNIYHYWEDGYSTPDFLIHFYGHNKWQWVVNEIYEEENTRMIVAVHADEQDMLMVMGDDECRFSTMPVSRIMLKNRNDEHSSERLENLRFVELARPDDYLLVLLKGSNGTLYYRTAKVKDLTEVNSFEGIGKSLTDRDHELVYCDIIGPNRFADFSKGLNERRDQYGAVMQNQFNESPQDMVMRFKAEVSGRFHF